MVLNDRFLSAIRYNQAEDLIKKGTGCPLCNNRNYKKDMDECWWCKRKWGQDALCFPWKKLIMSSQIHPGVQYLANCSLKKGNECGHFFHFSMQDLATVSNVCSQGFGKTILLGGSKYENRKVRRSCKCIKKKKIETGHFGILSVYIMSDFRNN